MNRSKILGQAAGIEWQGLTDKSIDADYIFNPPVVVGMFMRGRVDKPMLISKASINAELGNDSDNIDYQMVEAALELVDVVKVLRIAPEFIRDMRPKQNVSEAYRAAVVMCDFELTSIRIIPEAYQSVVKPLDFTLIDIVTKSAGTIEERYSPKIGLSDFTLALAQVIELYPGESYQSAITLKDFIYTENEVIIYET